MLKKDRHSTLLLKIGHHIGMLSGKMPEGLLPAGIRQAAAIEDKTAAMPALIRGQTLAERKAAYIQCERFDGKACQFFRGGERKQQPAKMRNLHRQVVVFKQINNIAQSVRDTGQEMALLLVKAPVSV